MLLGQAAGRGRLASADLVSFITCSAAALQRLFSQQVTSDYPRNPPRKEQQQEQ